MRVQFICPFSLTRSDITICSWNSPAPLASNTGLYLSRQTVRLTTEFVDWCRNVSTLYKHLFATPAVVISDLKQHLIDTWKSISQNVIDEAVGQWRKRLRASMKAKLKPAVFRANTLHNRLFSEPPTVYRGKHVVSRHFHCSYLKANKVSKSEGIKKVE